MQAFLQHAREFLPILLQGAVVTVQVTVLSFLLSSAIGLVLALGKLSPVRTISVCASTVINVIRGLPIIVQLFYIYFVLPDIGIQLTAFQAGVIGLGIAYSAYQAENFRAGIEAVDPGQREAALAMGMRPALLLRRVILPQAFRIVIPPMGNEFIAILKDTSLLSILSIRDLTQRMREFQSATFLTFAPYNTVAIVYVFLTLIAASLVARIEHRYRTHRH